MTTTTRRAGATKPETAYDMGLRSHMLSVYNYMASGILMTGIVALLCTRTGITAALYGNHHATLLGLVFMFAPMAYVFFVGRSVQTGSLIKGQIAFWSFTALMGVSMSTIFLAYTGTSIATTFFATATAFAGLSLYGYTTKRDLRPMGTFLVMALWGLIGALVINMFARSAAFDYLLSAVGILMFAGLTAYDTQRARDDYRVGVSADVNERAAIWGAMGLYLDFVNMMLFLLRFMGVKTGKD